LANTAAHAQAVVRIDVLDGHGGYAGRSLRAVCRGGQRRQGHGEQNHQQQGKCEQLSVEHLILLSSAVMHSRTEKAARPSAGKREPR